MRSLTILSLLAVAAASQAADTLTILGLAPGAGTLNLTGTQNGSFTAGSFDAKLNGGPTIQVYCADLLDFASYNVATPVSLVDTATLGSGYQQAARILNKYGATATTDVTKAALQGAIWKSIYGSALTIADGTAGATALATGYLAEDLSGYSNHATFYDFGGANQAMIGAQPVPEPASLAALGVGAMGLLRRRKNRR